MVKFDFLNLIFWNVIMKIFFRYDFFVFLVFFIFGKDSMFNFKGKL